MRTSLDPVGMSQRCQFRNHAPHKITGRIELGFGRLSNHSEGVVTAIAEVYNGATFLSEICDAVRNGKRTSLIVQSAQAT
jgi:hypothetical protein